MRKEGRIVQRASALAFLAVSLWVGIADARASSAPPLQKEVDWLAIAEENQALTEQRPHDGLAWLRWGQALLELGNASESIPVLERAEVELMGAAVQRGKVSFQLA